MKTLFEKVEEVRSNVLKKYGFTFGIDYKEWDGPVIEIRFQLPFSDRRVYTIFYFNADGTEADSPTCCNLTCDLYFLQCMYDKVHMEFEGEKWTEEKLSVNNIEKGFIGFIALAKSKLKLKEKIN
jgi:hypothetical protein